MIVMDLTQGRLQPGLADADMAAGSLMAPKGWVSVHRKTVGPLSKHVVVWED